MTLPAPPHSSGSAPVFFDASGKRWGRILTALFAGVLVLVLSIVWILPAATAPVHRGELNRAADYPRKLLALQDLENIPKIGLREKTALFHRIALVEKTDGKTLLRDPFSDTTWREATPAEILVIGSSPYVVEAYGTAPERTLMLTFDDGPDPRYTPEILDLLAREGVPATFFPVGDNVVKYPDIFRRTIREGHMVGNHTMSHNDFWAQDDSTNRQQIIGTDRVMRATDNYDTNLFRIPTGNPENNTLALLQAQQLGYLNINMDIDTRDWEYPPGAPIPTPQLSGKGHVVLIHDSGGDRTATIDMVRKLITEAKAQGYSFSTVQPLLPTDYIPKRSVPAVEDKLTLTALTTYLVTPNVVLNWLFWFGIGSLTILTFLFVVLALINSARQRRRRWDTIQNEDWPFVSVVLPVFNEELVVAKTLDALRASDYPLMEVVAVNDGSTDGTLGVLAEYADTWSALRVIDQPNGGKPAASNRGIDESWGDIIVTLDGDTLFEPQTIKKFARHFLAPRNGKEVGAVAGHVKVGNRRNLITAWQSLEYLSGICVTRMAEGLMGAIAIVPGACAAWRREALIKAGGYSHDTLAEDADLTLTLQRLGYSIVQENEAVAWTEAPMTIRGLFKQRLRWTYGNIQTLFKHRAMLFNPRYGALGMLTMPYALISVLVPLVFMPLTVVVAAISLSRGEWHAIVLFSAFVAATHMLISIVAVVMVRESLLHLLVVPIYRLIYEPLRAYVVFGSAIQALRGTAVGWYRPERTNSVTMSAAPGTVHPITPHARAS